MIPPQELQGHTPQTQLPQHSGEPARADRLGEAPDDGAASSASDGAYLPVPPRMTAFLQEPDTCFHKRPSLASILEMRQ